MMYNKNKSGKGGPSGTPEAMKKALLRKKLGDMPSGSAIPSDRQPKFSNKIPGQATYGTSLPVGAPSSMPYKNSMPDSQPAKKGDMGPMKKDFIKKMLKKKAKSGGTGRPSMKKMHPSGQ